MPPTATLSMIAGASVLGLCQMSTSAPVGRAGARAQPAQPKSICAAEELVNFAALPIEAFADLDALAYEVDRAAPCMPPEAEAALARLEAALLGHLEIIAEMFTLESKLVADGVSERGHDELSGFISASAARGELVLLDGLVELAPATNNQARADLKQHAGAVRLFAQLISAETKANPDTTTAAFRALFKIATANGGGVGRSRRGLWGWMESAAKTVARVVVDTTLASTKQVIKGTAMIMGDVTRALGSTTGGMLNDVMDLPAAAPLDDYEMIRLLAAASAKTNTGGQHSKLYPELEHTSEGGWVERSDGVTARVGERNAKYLGCFVDDAARDLRAGPRRYGYSMGSCAQACSSFSYFGLQNGGWCACGNSYATAPIYSERPRNECDIGFVGGGGAWRNAVYENTETRTTWSDSKSGAYENLIKWDVYTVVQEHHRGLKLMAFQGATTQKFMEQGVPLVFGGNLISDKIKVAIGKATEAVAEFSPNFITGHSLGGLLAECACSYTGVPGASFGAPGPWSAIDANNLARGNKYYNVPWKTVINRRDWIINTVGQIGGSQSSHIVRSKDILYVDFGDDFFLGDAHSPIRYHDAVHCTLFGKGC